MPIYEYRCKACGERFEELVSASAKKAPPCTSCGATGAKRLYSTFATEWIPSNVNWHQMPSKHDMGGAELSKPMTAIPKAIPGGKKKDAGKKKQG
jgi:putative FmdB family regulatory protein